MSLSVALNTAIAGLRVTQAGTELVGANIANAHDPNYTRKSLVTSNQVGLNSSQPRLQGIERRVAEGLQQDMRGLAAARGGAALKQSYAEKISQFLDLESNEPRLARMQSELETAFRDLAATPESDALAWQVVEKADLMAKEINKAAAAVSQLEQTAREDMGTAVRALNEKLADIDRLNKEIRSREGSNEPVGDLQDRRDAMIDEVAQLVDVRVMPQTGGGVSLYTSAGFQLVGQSARVVEWDGDNIVNDSGDPIESSFRGGRIGALADLRASDPAALSHPDSAVGTLAKLNEQLDALAQNLAGTVNTAYNAASTEPGELANNFFVAGTPSAATLEVNPNLLDGTARMKGAAGKDVSDALLDERFDVTAGGLSLTNTSVGGLVDSLLSRNAGHLATQKRATSEAEASLQAVDTKFRGLVGVDMDQEVAELIALQNAYAANARVVQTVTSMMDSLMEMVRR